MTFFTIVAAAAAGGSAVFQAGTSRWGTWPVTWTRPQASNLRGGGKCRVRQGVLCHTDSPYRCNRDSLPYM
jgi:hypothetical protein